MMIVMKAEATPEEVRAVVERVESVGAKAHVSQGEEVTVIGAVGDREHVQGLGQEGLHLLAAAKAESGLPVVTECMDARDLDAVLDVADVLQVGARNMQNYPLTEIGRSGRPVLLKRGLSSTLEELLMSAEYILKEGNEDVMLCERGIRTFETAYRFTLDLMAIPALKELTHLPVIVDPSHAAGKRDLVLPLSMAAAAVGADGVLVEVH